MPLLLNAPIDAEMVEPVDEQVALRDELEELRAKVDELEETLRQVTIMLRSARVVFGNAEAQAPAASVGGTNPRWEALKRSFPGRCAELVDTLIAHGSLSSTQIAAIMRADTRTVHQLIYKLNKAGGIVKNGGKFSLK